MFQNAVVYGRNYGDWPWMYICMNDACGARVSMHPFTNIPLGTLADEDTRYARKAAKAKFHRFQQLSKISRSDAYSTLAERMGIPRRECHFGWFDEEMAWKAQRVLKGMIKDLANPRT